MSHIIIIGNGFDRNLGFPTGYTDFIESPCFQALLPNNDLAQHLQRTHNLNNWIDVENEFQRYSYAFIERRRVLNLDKTKVKGDYLAIKNALREYLNSIDYTQYHEDSEAFRLMKKVHPKDVILDFNYTPTVENILKELGKPYEDEYGDEDIIVHRKVHGSLSDNNIVFGVSDDTEIFHEHRSFLKKSTTFGFPAVDFDNYFNDDSSISIFGHSLGNMDYDYFKDFFKKIVLTPSKDISINLYYKGDNDRDSINERLIELTDKCLGRFKRNLNKFEEIPC